MESRTANRNAIEIAEKAGALYDKFHGFLSNLELVGKSWAMHKTVMKMHLNNYQQAKEISSVK
jgi:DNA anti-recombination protein RmuC